MEKPRVLETVRPYDGKIVNLRIDSVRYPDGHTADREVVEHPGGAVIVPVLPNGNVLLIRQYRHPVGGLVCELPAGKLEPDEPPEICARRELEEETGYTSASLIFLTAIYTTPGFCNEMLHIYLARPVTPLAGGQALEPGESTLTVHEYSWTQIDEMILARTIVDGKTLSGLCIAKRVLEERHDS